jgi:hypothetical protein
MSDLSEAFVGLDTSKLRNSVAIAEGGRNGEVRFVGEIDNTPAAIGKLVKKLACEDQSARRGQPGEAAACRGAHGGMGAGSPS